MGWWKSVCKRWWPKKVTELPENQWLTPPKRRPLLDGPPEAVLPATAGDLTRPDVIELWLQAEWYRVEPMEVLQDLLEQMIANPDDPPVVLLGWRGGRPLALAVILPPRRLSGQAQVYHFYNKGGSRMRELLARNVVAYLRNAGYTEALAFATRGGPAWEKVFSAARPYKVADVYELRVNEA